MPLFLGALLSDLAYGSSYEVQWTNFASWLNAGALVFVALALLWALVDGVRADAGRGRGRWLHPLLVVATFMAGFVNALIHAKDAWAAMPAGTILSAICLLLSMAAIWTGFTVRGEGAAR